MPLPRFTQLWPRPTQPGRFEGLGLPVVSKRHGRGRPSHPHSPSSGQPESAKPKAPKAKDIFVPRPFAGLASEADWVALRELVPAATAPLRLGPDLVDRFGERSVTLATVLPMAWPALAKPDGRIFLGLQRGAQSGDVSRDLAFALGTALQAEPGGAVQVASTPADAPRLQDVLADGVLDITVHDGFDFWLDEQSSDPEVKASLERANASIFPTVKLATAQAAYWCRFPEKAHVRWVLTDDEDAALVALSRLAAAGELGLGEGTRFAGMFRAHGLLVPVWDLPRDPEATHWDKPLDEFAQRYRDALTGSGELDAAQRRARQGLLARQLTLR